MLATSLPCQLSHRPVSLRAAPPIGRPRARQERAAWASALADRRPEQRLFLTTGAGDVRGDDVGSVAVKGDPGSVVAHRRARVGVACRLLDITERYAGVEGGRYKGMAKSMRAGRLVDPGSTGNTPHDPARNMTVEAPPVRADEDGPGQPLTNCQVDRPSCSWCQKAPSPPSRLCAARLAYGGLGRALGPRCRPYCFGDAMAVQSEQPGESVLGR